MNKQFRAYMEQEVEFRRAGFPPMAKNLEELKEALKHAEEPIDWTHIHLPCGADDALAERRLGRIEYLRELIEAHEDKGPTGAIVREMSSEIRKHYENQLTNWICSQFDSMKKGA